MGIDFRSGGYVRFVRVGGRTIKDGEAAAIWDNKGQHRQVVGPARETMFYSTIRFLTRFKAERDQYLVVRHRDGAVEHIRGPAQLFENPALHDEVRLLDAIELRSEHEVAIIYNDDAPTPSAVPALCDAAPAAKDSTLDAPNGAKRIIRGPMLFFPKVGEHVHAFEWSHVPHQRRGETAKPFHVLPTQACQGWAFAMTLTTSDKMQVTAELGFVFDVDSVEQVLRAGDVGAKLRTGLIADAQCIGEGLSSAQFGPAEQASVTAHLAELRTYAHFCAMAASCGLRMSDVRMLGFTLSEKLQKQADSEQQHAATQRAELEAAKRARELHEMQFEAEQKNIDQQAALDRKKMAVQAALDAESHALKVAASERRLALQELEFSQKHKHQQLADERKVEYLRALKQEGVDMTAYLCSLNGVDTRKARDPMSPRCTVPCDDEVVTPREYTGRD